MRRIEYSCLEGIHAPRKERPELSRRFKSIVVGKTTRGDDKHLTDQEVADTLGASRSQVKRDLGTNSKKAQMSQNANPDPDDDIIDGEIVEDDEPDGSKESQDLALINDLRGPWSKGITQAARKMTPKARNHVIAALEAVLEEMRNMK